MRVGVSHEMCGGTGAARTARPHHIAIQLHDTLQPAGMDVCLRIGSVVADAGAARRVVDLAADQDTTDLQKCLACASRLIAADPVRFRDAHILAIGAHPPCSTVPGTCAPQGCAQSGHAAVAADHCEPE